MAAAMMFPKKQKINKKKEYRFEPPKKVNGYTPCLNNSCFFTDSPAERCAVHHVYFGNDRKKSEKWGMKVYLIPHWHLDTKHSVHMNKETDRLVKRFAQKEFERMYDHEFFIEIFGQENDVL